MRVSIAQAVHLLSGGKVVAVPTETVYGLAASIKSSSAIKRVFKLKGRPGKNPLIVHVANYQQALALLSKTPPHFDKLKNIWPAPLTVVARANLKLVSKIIRAGLSTVAIRVPHQKTLLSILKKTGPLAAPSANLSGKPSPTLPSHVENDFDGHIPVVYGAKCKNGVESTVIELKSNSFSVLRLGAWSGEKISHLLKLPEEKIKVNSKKSPGTRYKHYAPLARLVLSGNKNAISQLKFDAVLGFNDSRIYSGQKLLSLGARNSFEQNLKKLYQTLRKIDDLKFKNVLVDMDFLKSGLGLTLKDRLNRASCSQKKG